MHRYFLVLLALLFTNTPSMSQGKTDKLLANILAKSGNEALNMVLQNPDVYRVQIIYTQINRDKNNKPSFRNYYFNYDPDLYFNPASMVKLPLAALALEKLNTLSEKGINKFTTIAFDSSHTGQTPLYTDPTSETGKPSIAHFIKRAFLVSENDPYNRLYQFVGQKKINESLHQKGYKDSRIVRQFMPFNTEQNRYTNSVRFLNEDGQVIYHQPASYNTDPIQFREKVLIGKAHYDRNDSLVNIPFDFTEHNKLPLEDLQQILQSIMFPASVPEQQRFNIKESDYNFLRQYLSQYPSETPYPKYDSTEFYDSYVKFFFRNKDRDIPSGVRVFNKVGWSYGFLTDVSYVADFDNKVEYMLAATVYVNSDEILNDGKYEYDTVGYPFLYHLGQVIYNYELARKRNYKPDLSEFKLEYEHRDPADPRPSLKDVDN